MKFNKSKDGEMRATVIVKKRVGKQHLIWTLSARVFELFYAEGDIYSDDISSWTEIDDSTMKNHRETLTNLANRFKRGGLFRLVRKSIADNGSAGDYDWEEDNWEDAQRDLLKMFKEVIENRVHELFPEVIPQEEKSRT